MTIDIPVARESSIQRFGATDSLRQLPPRRPVSPPAASALVQWERVGLHRYQIRAGAETLGYVDVVGAVYVVRAGMTYDDAVEVAQTLVFEQAIAALGAMEEAAR